MRIENWDHYFMAMAKLAAARSGCNSRPTGAVIVKNLRIIATGYNGTISGKEQCSDHGDKYCLRREKGMDDKGNAKYQDCPSIHAEQNAINQVARLGGVNLQSADIYCTLQPCIFCLKNIASVGIKNIYFELPYASDDPIRDLHWSMKAKEYGIHCTLVSLPPYVKGLIFDIICHETSARRIM